MSNTYSDPLRLLDLYWNADPVEAPLLLEHILKHAIPIIQAVTRRDRSMTPREREEVQEIAETGLYTYLSPESVHDPINNFNGFMTRLTLNAKGKLLEKNNPLIPGLKSNVRYTFDASMKKNKRLAWWKIGASTDRVYGLKEWIDKSLPLSSKSLDDLRRDPRRLLAPLLSAHAISKERREEIFNAVFQVTSHPVQFTDLITIMICLDDRYKQTRLFTELEFEEEGSGIYLRLEDRSTNVFDIVSTKGIWQVLWTRLCNLTLKERSVYLLTWSKEGTITQPFIENGISVDEICAQLGMSRSKFAEIRHKLSLEDQDCLKLLEVMSINVHSVGNIQQLRFVASKKMQATTTELLEETLC